VELGRGGGGADRRDGLAAAVGVEELKATERGRRGGRRRGGGHHTVGTLQTAAVLFKSEEPYSRIGGGRGRPW